MVDVGDKTIDLSVSSRVNKLNNLLQGMTHTSWSGRVDALTKLDKQSLYEQQLIYVEDVGLSVRIHIPSSRHSLLLRVCMVARSFYCEPPSQSPRSHHWTLLPTTLLKSLRGHVEAG